MQRRLISRPAANAFKKKNGARLQATARKQE
jgi:hypothetical protein